MTSLTSIGLVVLISSGKDSGQPNEWSPQIDDTKINFEYLLQRRDGKQEKRKVKMHALRAKRKDPTLSHKTPVVAQDTPPVVAQDTPSLMTQGTQKPVTSKNKYISASKTKKRDLTPTEMQEVVDEANKKVDAVLANEGIVAKMPSWNHRADFPHDIQRLADKFVELTGIEPRKGKGANGNSPMAWLAEVGSWVSAGYTYREIEVAHWLSKSNPSKRRNGFYVTQPASLSNMLSMVHGQFKNQDYSLLDEMTVERQEQASAPKKVNAYVEPTPEERSSYVPRPAHIKANIKPATFD